MAFHALIVDDSSAVRAFVRAALEERGFARVEEAETGFEALRVLASNAFDIVIVDVNMPDINGLELLAFMKKSPRQQAARRILISTEVGQVDTQRGLELGADAFLRKPFQVARAQRAGSGALVGRGGSVTVSDPRDNVQQEFLAEAQELVEALSRDLLLLDEAHHRGERIDPALINEVFRSVHTLKGIAGMFGYQHVGAVAHALEDLLEDLRLGRTTINQQLLDVLVRLGRTLSALAFRRGPAVDGGGPERRRLHCRHPFDRLALGGACRRPGSTSTPSSPRCLRFSRSTKNNRLRACIREGLLLYRLRAAFELAAIDDSIERLRDDAQEDAEIITYLPSMEGGNEDTIELVVLLASRVPEPVLKAQFEGRYGTIEQPSRSEPICPRCLLSRLRFPLRQPACRSFRTTTASRPRFVQWPIPFGVDIRKLDHLMNVVGELALVRSAVTRVVDQLQGESVHRQSMMDLDRIGRSFERQLSELRKRHLGRADGAPRAGFQQAGSHRPSGCARARQAGSPGRHRRGTPKSTS